LPRGRLARVLLAVQSSIPDLTDVGDYSSSNASAQASRRRTLASGRER
jgi:hypothetical protein